MKKNFAPHHKKSADSAKGKKIILSSVFGCVVGILIFLGLLMSFSAICLAFDDPHILIYPLSFFILYSSAFFTGFAAVKKNGSCDALLCGCTSGAVLTLAYIIIFAAISTFIPNSSSQTISFLWRALVIPASVLGGYVASSTHMKKSRRF